MATREELTSLIDTYLDALSKNNPSAAPFAPNLKFTENCAEISIGEGLWFTARGREPGGLYFADTVAGQAGFFGVVREMDKQAMISLRLKVDGDKISEVETLVVREGAIIFQPQNIINPRPIFDEIVPPSERSSREELARINNLYFEAIIADKGDIVPVLDSCERRENGVQTTLSKESQFEVGKMGVRQQIDNGATHHIAAVRDRRFLIQDEERGLSFVIFFFEHPGNIESVAGRVPFGYPNSMIVPELFKIRNGQIVAIEALLDIFPYGTKSGWE